MAGYFIYPLVLPKGKENDAGIKGEEQSNKDGNPDSSVQSKPADPVIYATIVHNILENKCLSCHGEDKQKGDLRMDSLAAMLEGGSDEICLEPGDIKESFLLTSLDLPLDDDSHMPPKAKPQITPEEKRILTWWVAMGAPEKTKLSEVKVPAEITAAIATIKTPEEIKMIAHAKRKQKEDKLAANKANRKRLQSSWDAINAKFPGSLRYVSQDDTILTFSTVSYRKDFKDADLAILQEIAGDISGLDLSSTVITDAGLAQLKGLNNLKNLKLNDTKITDEAFKVLAELPSLETLNLYGTVVSDEGLKMIYSHPTLQKVYLWNTKVTEAGRQALQEAMRKRAKTEKTEDVTDEEKARDKKPEVFLGVASV